MFRTKIITLLIFIVAAISTHGAKLLTTSEIGAGAGISLSFPYSGEFSSYDPTFQYPVPIACWLDLFSDQSIGARGEVAWTQKSYMSSIEKTEIGVEPGQITRTGTLTYGCQMHYFSVSPLAKFAMKSAKARFYVVAGPKVDILLAMKEYEFDQGTIWHILKVPDNAKRMVVGIRSGCGTDHLMGKWILGICADIERNMTRAYPGNANVHNTIISLRLNIATPFSFDGKK